MAKAKKQVSSKKRGRPTLGNFCPLLTCGKTHRGHDGWRIVAGDGVLVHIKPKHVAEAIRAAEDKCVVALAFAEFFGPDYDISVGVSITKVISQKDKVELRLNTPQTIGRAIDVWDHKNGWNLPVGIYRFGKYKFPTKKRKKSFTGKFKKLEKTGNGGSVSVVITPRKKRKTRVRTTIRTIVRNARVKNVLLKKPKKKAG